MSDIRFELEFFAKCIQTDAEKLSYCIIQRRYNNSDYGCCRMPGLRVDGVREYVYSLTEGCFVRLGEVFGDSVILMESAQIKAVDNGYIFCTDSGVEEFFSIHDLTKVWYSRIMNNQLR